jgi:hypothetical protein
MVELVDSNSYITSRAGSPSHLSFCSFSFPPPTPFFFPGRYVKESKVKRKSRQSVYLSREKRRKDEKKRRKERAKAKGGKKL